MGNEVFNSVIGMKLGLLNAILKASAHARNRGKSGRLQSCWNWGVRSYGNRGRHKLRKVYARVSGISLEQWLG
ncbi:unnamed protein product [Prunus armeniaca]|uniref:Uncharacterized protein n=1 Tax=Prunus armeniaca TaxID=36596 RepID=A0A6J5THJ0_PRUAR|nr:unnamed protein product [Prunus armeniaca]